MTLVAGIDSSTQSTKLLVVDAETGRVVRSGRAPHPPGTEVDPDEWWNALQRAIREAGGIDDVAAVSVGGQQHGMVVLDANGRVVRPALLWNDTRSASDAEALVQQRGGGDVQAGRQWWVDNVGLVPVASFTATKLSWLARAERSNAARVAAVCLPHDWLTWRLAGYGPENPRLDRLVTDRSDASGTAYFDPKSNSYRPDILRDTLGHVPLLPEVLGPLQAAGCTPSGTLLAAGAGDNAAAALGIGAEAGDIVVSVGTSGTVFAVSQEQVHDPTGMVAGFADAAGGFLPLAATLNASLVLDAVARLLALDPIAFDELARRGPSSGLRMVPYLSGERTPNLPNATGTLLGITLDNLTPSHLARAAIEGVVCSLADACAAVEASGVAGARAIFVGGGARYRSLQEVAAQVFSMPLVFPEPAEYVALGVARQAAGTIKGALPGWTAPREELAPRNSPEPLAGYRRATHLLWSDSAIPSPPA
ncbi:Xylulose kinase [Microbacterium esteraromaticum]|uniref:Xylulose kinase n=1 Tax=Microbacterium esteraromaticum TaxID=57043 RepID=A0A1R4K6K5_9MICO|nr:FGGY family carbohydrate kinase [Microbacterium esteraromaticum]SJN39878.1 Xylulose kinase [Microbacterium esteraromaticum]